MTPFPREPRVSQAWVAQRESSGLERQERERAEAVDGSERLKRMILRSFELYGQPRGLHIGQAMVWLLYGRRV